MTSTVPEICDVPVRGKLYRLYTIRSEVYLFADLLCTEILEVIDLRVVVMFIEHTFVSTQIIYKDTVGYVWDANFVEVTNEVTDANV